MPISIFDIFLYVGDKILENLIQDKFTKMTEVAKKPFQERLSQHIFETINNYAAKYPQSSETKSFPFYESQTVIDVLIEYRYYENNDYSLLKTKLDTKANLLPYTEDNLTTFCEMFREKVEKDKELIRLEREMGYKEKIYEIDLSIKNIERTIDKIYMMVSNEKIAKASITGDNNIIITDANGNDITIYRGNEEMLKKSFETLMQQIINLPQEIAELLQKQHASYKNTHSELLLPFLERKFKEDLHPKLLQAGDHADTKLRLERVFMDMYATPDGNIPKEKEIPKFVQSTLTTFGKTHTEECIRHFVLIGNFGYGKSTLTQFLMQVFRAHLIDVLRDGLSTKNVKDFLIDYPFYDYPTIEIQRLPLIFPLNEYAGWLAAQKKEKNNHSVLAYIQYEIKRHEKETDFQTIRDILKTYPLLVVFDGLDEVPSSANRSEVLAEMEHFVENDLFHLQTDVMILVTTRPQSYNNELDDKKYLHLKLTDLSKEDCLEYMSRLLKNSDLTEDKQAENLAILTQAAEDGMIADLMKTPLQATIMEILVRSGGEPPKDRYKLFKNYYETIWKRESQKQSNITINSNNDTHFKEVHKIFGLAVQKLSEDEKNPSASFTQAKFKTLITSYQSHIEWNKNTEESYLDEVYIAIVQRIQFIVERGQEEVRFTIRSLQEYFAALAYFNCKETFFPARMLAIAKNANWRNTFLFGMGYLVNERKYQIEDIIALCHKLNGCEDAPKTQSLEKIGKFGSRLALDILKNGIFNGMGKYENTFASLLEPLFDIEIHENETIAKLPHHIIENFILPFLEKRIIQTESTVHLNAWNLLLALLKEGYSCEDIAEKYFEVYPDKYFLLKRLLNEYSHENKVIPFLIKKVLLFWEETIIENISRSYLSYLWGKETLSMEQKQYIITYTFLNTRWSFSNELCKKVFLVERPFKEEYYTLEIYKSIKLKREYLDKDSLRMIQSQLKECSLDCFANLIEVLLFPTKENILLLLESMKDIPNYQFEVLFSWNIGILKLIFADFNYPYTKAQIEPAIQKVKTLDLQNYEEYPEIADEKNIPLLLEIYDLEIDNDLSLSADEYINFYEKYKFSNKKALMKILKNVTQDSLNTTIEKIAINLYEGTQDIWDKTSMLSILISKLTIPTMDNYLQHNKDNSICYYPYLTHNFNLKKNDFQNLLTIFSIQTLQNDETDVIILVWAALICEKQMNNENIHVFTISLEQLIAFPFKNQYNQFYRILLVLIHKDYGLAHEKQVLALVEELSIHKKVFLQEDNRDVFSNIYTTFITFLLYKKHHISILLKMYEWIPQDIEHQNIIWIFQYAIKNIGSRMPVKLNDKERMKELGFEEYLIADEVF